MTSGQLTATETAPPVDPQRLRLLSYNIQVGISSSRYRHYVTHSWKHVLPFEGRKTNLDKVARFIRGFDVVGLQEADAGSLRSDYVNQVRYLAAEAGFPYWYCQTNRNLGVFAQHSLGLLGRCRPYRMIEHRLPGRIPGRGALEARFGSPDNPLIVILLHLSLGKKSRQRQIDYVTRILDHREHVIVMGDLNCHDKSAELKALVNQTHLCKPDAALSTWPSWEPVQPMDHILVTPELIVERARVFHVDYSDHLPISTDVVVPEDIDLNYSSPASDISE